MQYLRPFAYVVPEFVRQKENRRKFSRAPVRTTNSIHRSQIPKSNYSSTAMILPIFDLHVNRKVSFYFY